MDCGVLSRMSWQDLAGGSRQRSNDGPRTERLSVRCPWKSYLLTGNDKSVMISKRAVKNARDVGRLASHALEQCQNGLELT